MSANDISAECAVLMTAQTGEVIFQRNAHQMHSMASTTKIMTSLLAVESGKLRNEIKVDASMLAVEGTSMGLVVGDSVSLNELVYGMLLPSGNDAANVTALYLGGTRENFAQMMNKRAEEIGMLDTNFVTPSGLDHENHYSTAYDMALLGREAVSNPEFLKICSSKKARLTYGNPPYERTLYNHNRLLSSYPTALGIKTGFTKKSGRCLVSYAEKDGVGLVAVTLNDKNDWYDHKQMLNYGFSAVKAENIEFNYPTSINVVGGNKSSVALTADEFTVDSMAKNITYEIRMPKFIYAPVKIGDVIGELRVFSDGKIIGSVSITANESVEIKTVEIKEESKGFFERIKEFLHG